MAVALSLVPLLARPTPFVMDDAYRDAELEIGDRWQTEAQIEIDGILVIGRGLLVGRLGRDKRGRATKRSPIKNGKQDYREEGQR